MNAVMDMMSEGSDYSQDYIAYVLKHNWTFCARFRDFHILIWIISETPLL